MNSTSGWTAKDLDEVLDGHWLVPPAAGWYAAEVALYSSERGRSKPCLFIAIDEATWINGTHNTGIYAR